MFNLSVDGPGGVSEQLTCTSGGLQRRFLSGAGANLPDTPDGLFFNTKATLPDSALNFSTRCFSCQPTWTNHRAELYFEPLPLTSFIVVPCWQGRALSFLHLHILMLSYANCLLVVALLLPQKGEVRWNKGHFIEQWDASSFKGWTPDSPQFVCWPERLHLQRESSEFYQQETEKQTKIHFLFFVRG